jgi:prevent-host-death family protein
MEHIISATEARARLGELIRHAAETGEAVIITRRSRPQAVLLSLAEYERLKANAKEEQSDALERILRLGDEIRARRGGKPLMPPPEEVIRQMREERDEQLLGRR